MRAEARRLVRLVPRDRRALELRALGLLEDRPQPLERLPRLAPDPAGGADLLEAVDDGGRLAEGGELHAGDVRRLACEVVDGDRAVAAAPAHPDLLDDLPRAVGLRDRQLRVLVRERRVELEAGRGADTHRLYPSQAVVVHVVVRERRPGGEVADEVEDGLARGRDDCRDGDLAHARGSYLPPRTSLRRGHRPRLAPRTSLRRGHRPRLAPRTSLRRGHRPRLA